MVKRNQPIAPIDVQLQKSVTGELIAFDTKNKIILASGLEDDEEFEKWKKQYFAPRF